MKNRTILIAIAGIALSCQNAQDNDVTFRNPLSGSGGAPAAVTTLASGTITRTSIQVKWTAVGATGNVGTAASYELRYLSAGSCPINAGNFSAGTAVSGLPAPQSAGASESVTVTGLTVGTSYCFALQVTNTAALTSDISNVLSVNTLPVTTAIGVYGQSGSFTTGTANKGGLSANSLSVPRDVAIDSAGGIYIADTGNHRVLYFASGSTTATRVYGQPDFTSATANNGGISADSLSSPRSVAVSDDGVYISDFDNNRVLYYAGTSTTATRVYGQGGSFTSGTLNITASSTNVGIPMGIAVDSTGLYIVGSVFHRVTFYAGTSTTATRVYGQGSMTTSTSGSGAGNLNNPADVALDANGVYISDMVNNRVKFHPGTSTTATIFYGQSSNSSTLTGTSTTRLSSPVAIASTADGLYVADFGNMRAVYFPHASATQFNAVATLVYGQSGSFSTNGANNGGRSANSLNEPWGIAADSNGVYIADRLNQRVLSY